MHTPFRAVFLSGGRSVPGAERTCLHLVDELGLFFIWGEQGGGRLLISKRLQSTRRPSRQTDWSFRDGHTAFFIRPAGFLCCCNK